MGSVFRSRLADHWGIVDGRDVSTPIYHRTHSCYAVAAFHEALRIILGYGRHRKASDYAYHENALRQAVEAMGCDVISNTTSLIGVSDRNTCCQTIGDTVSAV